MIYSDDEYFRWWESLSETRKQEIFDTMIENANTYGSKEFATSLMNQFHGKKRLSVKQLAAIRKWDQ